jgi:hypothetical protein
MIFMGEDTRLPKSLTTLEAKHLATAFPRQPCLVHTSPVGVFHHRLSFRGEAWASENGPDQHDPGVVPDSIGLLRNRPRSAPPKMGFPVSGVGFPSGITSRLLNLLQQCLVRLSNDSPSRKSSFGSSSPPLGASSLNPRRHMILSQPPQTKDPHGGPTDNGDSLLGDQADMPSTTCSGFLSSGSSGATSLYPGRLELKLISTWCAPQCILCSCISVQLHSGLPNSPLLASPRE